MWSMYQLIILLPWAMFLELACELERKNWANNYFLFKILDFFSYAFLLCPYLFIPGEFTQTSISLISLKKKNIFLICYKKWWMSIKKEEFS